jgi:nucleotide-binding universal stress UspA family protein
MFNRILVPLDGSPLSERAIDCSLLVIRPTATEFH